MQDKRQKVYQTLLIFDLHLLSSQISVPELVSSLYHDLFFCCENVESSESGKEFSSLFNLSVLSG